MRVILNVFVGIAAIVVWLGIATGDPISQELKALCGVRRSSAWSPMDRFVILELGRLGEPDRHG